MRITENHSLGFKMKSSPLSPEWRKKRQEMTEKLIRKGDAFFNKQELIQELKRRIKNMNRFK